jgi:hypothetical protein
MLAMYLARACFMQRQRNLRASQRPRAHHLHTNISRLANFVAMVAIRVVVSHGRRSLVLMAARKEKKREEEQKIRRVEQGERTHV